MRFKFKIFLLVCFSIGVCFAQNDLDALRYSQSGVGGSNRFKAMGGAFGAIGADVGCLNYNPAGIGVYRKGEVNFSFNLKFSNNQTSHYGTTTNASKANFAFGNFGIAGSWNSKKNENERHSLGFSNSQLQNFTGTIVYNGNNRKSIANDMLSLTNGKRVSELNGSYEGLGFNSYLLDTSSTIAPYYSFVDPAKTIAQSKEIEIKGRMNEMAFGYAYGYKDVFYFGASLGIPTIRYNYISVHTETDVNDSMYTRSIGTNSYVTSYSNLPASAFYKDLLGFKSLSYTEKFSTEGTGYNLKLGFLARLNDFVRAGAYVHTPSFFNLTDKYTYNLDVTWDTGKTTKASYPDKEGIYDYTLTTPARYGGCVSFIYKKLMVLGIDYEGLNYGHAQLGSKNPKDFNGVNVVIKNKYKQAHNLRFGTEFNIKPVLLRAGYAMYGSPFGGIFNDKFTRNIYSLGLGLRMSSGFYFDFMYSKQISKEDYYVLRPSYMEKSNLTLAGTTFAFSVGCKF
jgi:hypothetical protein